MASDWFNTLWQKRIPTTVNVSQVPSTQNNFPLLINSIFTDLIGVTLDELRFAGIDKVQLDYEIQKFDSITGELVAWVKKPTISDGEITYIYYDNPAAVDEQNPSAVWDSNYKSVYHMQSNGNDSTSNAQNLTQFGTALTPVSGKIGNAANYGGTVNDYSIRNPFAGFPSNEITVEFWIQTTQSGASMFHYFVTSSNQLVIALPEQLFYELFASFVLDGSVLNDGLFHHITLTWKSVGGTLNSYVDGAFVFSVGIQSGQLFIDNNSLVLSQQQTSVGGGFTASYNGILDEVRISDNIRSADYVTTTHNNQNNPGAFYSISPSEQLLATKTVTADLCVNTDTKNDLCVTELLKEDLCVNNSIKADLCV